jgi:hypothetical protein
MEPFSKPDFDIVKCWELLQLLCKFIEQGARSPRTMRLTALHITGLWLQYPTIAIFYVKQLKLLSLHGGGKWVMVFHFFDIKNLVKFIKKLAKLVEFTLEKQKFPNFFVKS